jgi:hypothetical protein
MTKSLQSITIEPILNAFSLPARDAADHPIQRGSLLFEGARERRMADGSGEWMRLFD